MVLHLDKELLLVIVATIRGEINIIYGQVPFMGCVIPVVIPEHIFIMLILNKFSILSIHKLIYFS